MDKKKAFKMPTYEDFLSRAINATPAGEPPWVYLEREMKEMAAKGIKPYNNKVGEFLKFMKGLRSYSHKQEKKKRKRLQKIAEPVWFMEFSTTQINIVKHLNEDITQDLLEDWPKRVARALTRLGITIRFKKTMLMKTMDESMSDPGLFMWYLYVAYYEKDPTVLLPKYSHDAMLMMSSMVFADYDETLRAVDRLLVRQKRPAPKPPKPERRFVTPTVRFGEYLQQMKVICPPESFSERQKRLRIEAEKKKLKKKLANNVQHYSSTTMQNQNYNFDMNRYKDSAQSKKEKKKEPSRISKQQPPVVAPLPQVKPRSALRGGRQQDRNQDLGQSGAKKQEQEQDLGQTGAKKREQIKTSNQAPAIIPASNKTLRKSSKPNFQNEPAKLPEPKPRPHADFAAHHPKPPKPPPLDYKIKLKSDESYERLTEDKSFLNRRKMKHVQEEDPSPECGYNFWEPPVSLRNTDPKKAAFIQIMKMLTIKAKPKHIKSNHNVETSTVHVGGVSYTGGVPNYILNNTCLLSSGYIPHNGGVVRVQNEYLTLTCGYYKFPKEELDKCPSTCDCLMKWEDEVRQYLKKTKCRHYHFYDLCNEGKPKEQCFHPATAHRPYCLDKAKVYQMDPTEDFIINTVQEALNSRSPSPTNSQRTIPLEGMPVEQVVGALLADLATETDLIIPHLPHARRLKFLQAWTNRRIKGSYISPKKHKNLIKRSQRRWCELSSVSFGERSYFIPFTLQEQQNMTYGKVGMMKKISKTLYDKFQTENKKNIIKETRLWWSTMESYLYPSKRFLDTFFSYMPARMNDVFLINPYGCTVIPRTGRTCPLEKINRLQ